MFRIVFTHTDDEDVTDIKTLNEAHFWAEEYYDVPCAIINEMTGQHVSYYLGFLGFVSVH